MKTRSAILFLLSTVLSGCATHASVRLFSEPEGAYLTAIGSGKVYGVAPATAYYDPKWLSNFKGADGCYRVKGFEARWVSGATKVLDPMTLCGSSTGIYNITLSRAPTHPDLERDLQFALELQSARAQQQKARAARDAADAVKYRAIRGYKCTTTQRKNSVETECN